MIDAIVKALGDKADFFLKFSTPKICKERLHVPGPDWVDRIFAQSDRTTRVLVNLQRLYATGRLAGTGYLSILPSKAGVTRWRRRSACSAAWRANMRTRSRSL
jgi:class I fructose-bisphosphate aldolase